MHDPAKVLLDLAVALALGGDCLADIAVLRIEPGPVRVGGVGYDVGRWMYADDLSSYRGSKLVDVSALNMQWRD